MSDIKFEVVKSQVDEARDNPELSGTHSALSRVVAELESLLVALDASANARSETESLGAHQRISATLTRLRDMGVRMPAGTSRMLERPS